MQRGSGSNRTFVEPVGAATLLSETASTIAPTTRILIRVMCCHYLLDAQRSGLPDRRWMPSRAKAMAWRATGRARSNDVACEHDEPALGGDAGHLLVERPRADPGDLAARVVISDVDETRHQQRLAEAVPAMGRPRPGRPEPAKPAVVAVVGGERAVRAVPERDVHAGRIEA